MADEYYIPFDIGTWRTKPGQTATCTKHGVQAGGLVIQVHYVPGGTFTRREYCGYCVLDVLDSLILPLEIK